MALLCPVTLDSRQVSTVMTWRKQRNTKGARWAVLLVLPWRTLTKTQWWVWGSSWSWSQPIQSNTGLVPGKRWVINPLGEIRRTAQLKTSCAICALFRFWITPRKTFWCWITIDRRAPLCGIHLPGNHVISVFVLGPRSGSRPYSNRRRCCFRLVHFFDRLVSDAVNLETALAQFHREFCVRHPEVRDVCDLGQMLFYGWRWVWYATAVMFLLNNTMIQVRRVLSLAPALSDISRAYTYWLAPSISIQWPTVACVLLASLPSWLSYASYALCPERSTLFRSWQRFLPSLRSFPFSWRPSLLGSSSTLTITTLA